MHQEEWVLAKGMKILAVASLLLTAITAGIYGQWKMGWILSAAITFGTIAYHLWMRLLVGVVLDAAMKNRADYTKRWYQLLPFEEELYKKWKVKQWKGNMPTYAPEIFSMKIHTPDEIAQAMCQAEIVHEVNVVLSFLPLFGTIWFGAFPVFLVTSLLAAGYDLLFVIMQRYNRPRMIRLAKSMKKRK